MYEEELRKKIKGKSKEEIRKIIAYELKLIQDKAIKHYCETEEYEKAGEILKLQKKDC